MRCETVNDHLDAWLDESLDARLRSAVDEHLAECDSCRREFARHRALADDMFVLGRIADRIVDAPAHDRRRRARWIRVGKFAAVVTIAIGAALAGWSWAIRGVPRQFADNVPIAPAPAPNPEEHTALCRFEYEPPDPGRQMVVSVKSDNPRIHIVWLYENTLGVPVPPKVDGTEPELHRL